MRQAQRASRRRRGRWELVAKHPDREALISLSRDPKHLTPEFSKADRGGRIYVDVGRNNPGATFAAVYAVRARPGAPVSAPCTWEEIEQGKVGPQTFTVRAMARRMKDVGDLWSDVNKRKRSIAPACRRSHCRSPAVSGSIRDARNDGTKQAHAAMTPKNSATEPYTSGSSGRTLTSSV